MSCLRCSTCGIHWPDSREYDPCPECHGRTDRFQNQMPGMSKEEAKSRWNHARFRDYVEERGEKPLPPKLQQDVDRAYDAADAQQVELSRTLRQIREAPAAE